MDSNPNSNPHNLTNEPPTGLQGVPHGQDGQVCGADAAGQAEEGGDGEGAAPVLQAADHHVSLVHGPLRRQGLPAQVRLGHGHPEGNKIGQTP